MAVKQGLRVVDVALAAVFLVGTVLIAVLSQRRTGVHVYTRAAATNGVLQILIDYMPLNDRILQDENYPANSD